MQVNQKIAEGGQTAGTSSQEAAEKAKKRHYTAYI